VAEAERRYRLLVVDDDEIDARQYGRLLERKAPGRVDLQVATTGDSGLALLRAGRVDCVLLDFRLPDMTGLEFLATAAIGGDIGCAVVLVTGQGNEDIAVAAMQQGAQDYLVKDRINEDSLWRAMTRAVLQVELRQRLAASHRALAQEATIRKAAELELRAAKQAAEEANAAKTRFVAMVTHELRTPLNGILGYAQLLQLEGGLSSRQQDRISAMMLAGHHLLGTIERVLDYAAIEAGHVALRPEEIELAGFAERCIAVVLPLATERGLTLRQLHRPDAPVRLVADPGRLRQVLLNLLGNAVKYTDAGGVELRFAAGASPGAVRIEVADTGRGIADDKLRLLFHDFERLGAVASVEGAGLGLSIAVRLVRELGGELGHVPQAGGGSVFWIDLPPAAPALPEPAPPVAALPTRTGLRILLVDDIAMNRDVIGAFITTAGHKLMLAGDGELALRICRRVGVDLVLMDVQMPGMDGLEATRRIRALPGPRGEVPILGLTAYADKAQVARCLAAGMDGQISKPVDYATLVREIAAAAVPRRVIASAPPPPAMAGFDRGTFEATVDCLPPAIIEDHLQSLRRRIQDLIQLLDGPANPTMVQEAAHGMVSTAGMFGLTGLSGAARRLQDKAACGSPTARPARTLRREATASLGILTKIMATPGLLPP